MLSIKVERLKKDKRLGRQKETDKKTSEISKAKALRCCTFRCNVREDIFFLSGAPGRDELHRTLYNDWLFHWWQKPSPPKLLAAYGSTDEPCSFTMTVTALQSDSRVPTATATHTHKMWSRACTQTSSLFVKHGQHNHNITHTNTHLSPIPQSFKYKKSRASCHRPALRHKGDWEREGMPHTQEKTMLKARPCYLFMSLFKTGRLLVSKKTLLGAFFSWQWGLEHALIYVAWQEGIFREGLLAEAEFRKMMRKRIGAFVVALLWGRWSFSGDSVVLLAQTQSCHTLIH